MRAFAAVEDLVGSPPDQVPWLNADQLALIEGDEARILLQASRVVAEAATSGYTTDAQGAPVLDWEIAALRDATCAQVEQWLEVGEENDIAGYSRATAVSAGALNLSALPAILAPRARRILRAAGLTSAVAY